MNTHTHPFLKMNRITAAMAACAFPLMLVQPSTAFAQQEAEAADDADTEVIIVTGTRMTNRSINDSPVAVDVISGEDFSQNSSTCLLYTSPSPRDISGSRMPSSA